jgi:hypothetical protein
MTEQDPHWPALPLEAWEPTRATLHMWTQIVGKVRLALSTYMNHWWEVPLYVTARGLRAETSHAQARMDEKGEMTDGRCFPFWRASRCCMRSSGRCSGSRAAGPPRALVSCAA